MGVFFAHQGNIELFLLRLLDGPQIQIILAYINSQDRKHVRLYAFKNHLPFDRLVSWIGFPLAALYSAGVGTR